MEPQPPDPRTITAWRLRAQQLVTSSLHTPAAVVAWLGGIQAQDYAGACLSIGLRLPAATLHSVEQAVTTAAIIRTWAFRGTLHFVAAADVGWLTALLAPGLIAGNARRYRQLELEESDFNRSNRVIEAALAREQPLARSQLAAALEAAGISAAGQRAPYLLQRAALAGLICHHRPQGRETTYVLLADRVPPGRQLTREEALAELAARYLTSHGPATVADFAWWCGLPVKTAREAFALVEPRFINLPGEERTFWADENYRPDTATTTAHLLPPFDEHLLGYKDRRHALDPQHVKRINAGGGMPKPAVLVNGRVAGVWRRAMKRGQVQVTWELFRPAAEVEEAAIAAAARRVARFFSQ